MVVFRSLDRSYNVCMNTVIADGKPHKRISITNKAATNIIPLLLISPDTFATPDFDVTGDNYGGGDGEQGIYLTEIPDVYPGRNDFDKTTAFASAATGIPAYKLEVGRWYHVTTGDLTAEHEGLFLKCGAAGILDEPAVPAKTAPDIWGHGFMLIAGVSTAESIVEYLGPNCEWDDSA